MNIRKHIIEHEILGIRKSTTGGASSRPPEFKVLRTSAFTPVISQTQYTITDNANGTILKGFNPVQIQTTGAQVTNLSNKPVYDNSNIFTRNRVIVTNVTGAVVTLSHVPSEDFIIHYRYFLGSDNYVSNYVPDDIVVAIEAEYNISDIAQHVAFDYTAGGYITDTNVQDALDTILQYLYDGAAKQTVRSVPPSELPNGVITTFTIPFGHEVRGDNISVYLNGVKYSADNIILKSGGTQFEIINGDHVPKAIDELEITYERRI